MSGIRPQVEFDRPSDGGRWRPGDWLTLGYIPPVLPGGLVELRGVDTEAVTLEAAAAEAEHLAGVPGAWWRGESPPELLEPVPEQSVVWTLMYPRGHARTGTTGYGVQWHRNTRGRRQ
jgi:hypothetical protein